VGKRGRGMARGGRESLRRRERERERMVDEGGENREREKRMKARE